MADGVASVPDKGNKGRAAADSGLSNDDLLALFRALIRTRLLDERAMNLQRQGRIGFYVPSTGQEAAHVGSAFAARREDWIFPSYREPGIPLLRGVPVRLICAQWYGKGIDLAKGRQMPCHYAIRDAHFVSISSPIGTQIVQAVGAAWAAKIRKDPVVALTYFGDGATSSNDFHTGLNFAGVYKAPVVFICQNNGWAITLPRAGQTASATIASKAGAYGFDGVRVDGNDVLAVHRVAREAIDKARAGGGPTLIEAVTYRMGPHSTSDDPRRYRDDAECEAWRKKDPIDRFRAFLVEHGVADAAFEEKVRAEATAEIEDAVKEVEAEPFPPRESIFDDVFARLTPRLEAQRDELLREPPREKGH